MQLARDALSSGDNVAAENYFQHAEHYNRIIAAAQVQAQQGQQEFRPREYGDDDGFEGERSMNGRGMDFGRDDRSQQADQDDDADEAPPPQQQAAEPERQRRRRRPRSDEDAEAAAPHGGEKRANSNGAGGEEDLTHDGRAALAAFPD